VLTALWSVYTEQDRTRKRWRRKRGAGRFTARATGAVRRRALLIELKRFDGAWKELTALYAQARGAAVSNALGIVQLRRAPVADMPAAPSYFERAIGEDPNNTDYRFNLGYATSARRRDRRRADRASRSRPARRGRRRRAPRDERVAQRLGTRAGVASRAGSGAPPRTSLETAPSTPPAKVPPGLERLQTDLDTTSPVEAR
jgi:hypothetical protein